MSDVEEFAVAEATVVEVPANHAANDDAPDINDASATIEPLASEAPVPVVEAAHVPATEARAAEAPVVGVPVVDAPVLGLPLMDAPNEWLNTLTNQLNAVGINDQHVDHNGRRVFGSTYLDDVTRGDGWIGAQSGRSVAPTPLRSATASALPPGAPMLAQNRLLQQQLMATRRALDRALREKEAIARSLSVSERGSAPPRGFCRARWARYMVH